MMPTDVVVASEFSADAQTRTVPVTEIPEGWLGLDVGPDSVESPVFAVGSTGLEPVTSAMSRQRSNQLS